MKPDVGRWIAEANGIPIVEEGPDGLVMNKPARTLLGGHAAGDLPTVVSYVVQAPTLREDISRAAVEARAGERSVLAEPQGKWKLFVAPSDEGRAQVIAVPAAIGNAGALYQQAAAANLAASVSHEVANALSAIIGWSQLATSQTGTHNAAEALTLIEASARAARNAARHLLSSVRTGEGGAEVTTDVRAVVKEVNLLLRPQSVERGVHVELRLQTDGPCYAQGSRPQLFTVLWNLLKNAVEATPAGGKVIVSVAARGGEVQIEVVDSGRGMDAVTRARAFDPYFSTKAEGTGIGLPLVKQTVEQMGGVISLSSASGQGARLAVNLPEATKPSSAPPGAAGARGTIPAAEGGRVLVIDDDEGVRGLISTALSLRGARVTGVTSGAEARALTGPFDIGLVDLALEDERGDRLLRDLLDKGVLRSGVLMTGAVSVQVPGFEPDAILRKPFELADLEALMGGLLRQVRGVPEGELPLPIDVVDHDS